MTIYYIYTKTPSSCRSVCSSTCFFQVSLSECSKNLLLSSSARISFAYIPAASFLLAGLRGLAAISNSVWCYGFAEAYFSRWDNVSSEFDWPWIKPSRCVFPVSSIYWPCDSILVFWRDSEFLYPPLFAVFFFHNRAQPVLHITRNLLSIAGELPHSTVVGSTCYNCDCFSEFCFCLFIYDDVLLWFRWEFIDLRVFVLVCWDILFLPCNRWRRSCCRISLTKSKQVQLGLCVFHPKLAYNVPLLSHPHTHAPVLILLSLRILFAYASPVSTPPSSPRYELCSSLCPGTVTEWVFSFSFFPLSFLCCIRIAAEDLPALYDPSDTIDHMPYWTAVRNVSFVELLILDFSGENHVISSTCSSIW